MTRRLLQAAALVCLGGLITQGASAGTTIGGTFNTFTFADGPIMSLGAGQSMVTGNLMTTFSLTGDPTLSNFMLNVAFTGPGAPGPFVPTLDGVCSGDFGFDCSIAMPFTFQGVIMPGDVLGAVGTLSNGESTLDTAGDSFVATAAPEPSALALTAIGLAGIRLGRRRPSRR